MVTRTRMVRRLVLVAVLLVAPGHASAQNAVLEWNDIARQLIVVPSQSPVQQTRLMAIVHVAMHNAVNAITGEYEQYGTPMSAPAGRTRGSMKKSAWCCTISTPP